MKQLQNYEQYQNEKLKLMFKDGTDEPTGVACPKCGKELRVDLTRAYASIPPKNVAWCSNMTCDWEGYLYQ